MEKSGGAFLLQTSSPIKLVGSLRSGVYTEDARGWVHLGFFSEPSGLELRTQHGVVEVEMTYALAVPRPDESCAVVKAPASATSTQSNQFFVARPVTPRSGQRVSSARRTCFERRYSWSRTMTSLKQRESPKS